jgi:ubiquinone/menaquinone biosynthesis C-methylase UbiE
LTDLAGCDGTSRAVDIFPAQSSLSKGSAGEKMHYNDTRKLLVRESYDREAERYKNTSSTQQTNLRLLLSLADKHLRELKPKRIVDIGCGAGGTIEALREANLFDGTTYLGIDLSSRMIALAMQTHHEECIQFRTGDAENLEVEDASTDLVVANAMLHWLNQPKFGNTPVRALSEMHRILRPAGLVVISSPAVEAFRFRQAYHSVVSRFSELSSFKPALYCEDPLGSMRLSELVAFAQSASFKIELATTLYQTFPYESAMSYADSVRGYAFSAYMAPFAPELHEKVWLEISDEFCRKIGSGLYMHEIYTNYMVLRKN